MTASVITLAINDSPSHLVWVIPVMVVLFGLGIIGFLRNSRKK